MMACSGYPSIAYEKNKKFFHTLYTLHAVIGNVLFTILTPGISWQGHLGGAAAGALVSLLLIRREQQA